MGSEVWVSPKSGMRFRLVPAGVFLMGSGDGERGRGTDEILREVRLSRDYWVSEFHVTQGVFRAVNGQNPTADGTRLLGGQESGPCNAYQGVSLVDDSHPVTCVSWFDAIIFANALSKLEGFPPAYVIKEGLMTWDTSSQGYRLLSEAEWERAARGQETQQLFSGSNSYDDVCSVANVGDESAVAKFGWQPIFDQSGWSWCVQCHDRHESMAPVGSYLPNSFGLYDLTGNAIEWVWDFYGTYVTGPKPVVDPMGPTEGLNRVGRGGGWMNPAVFARVAHRGQSLPSRREIDLGFRLCRFA
jgi:formylglycine-generating enzyme required for sulfatase activity